jgi:ZIP family zinc transporter
MPIFGGLVSLTFSLSAKFLAIYLGFFAGFLLYIAASNLVPQAHSEKISRRSLALTVTGAAFMLVVTQLA